DSTCSNARPDIRKAQWEVAAARMRKQAAQAARKPKLSVDANIGVDSRQIESWFDDESVSHNFGPSFRWDAINFGRAKAEIRAAEARYCQAVARYQQVVLIASEEVERAIIDLRAAGSRIAALELAAKASAEVAAMASHEYVEGLTTFQTVLDAQRQQLSAENQLASARADAVFALIAYFKALGGGLGIDRR
ncbi:MAG: TolC family protein, partial [Planctomycetales bacterium]|nr:TolC family protein [Planctomycetales bacterium]